jgi:hypothetical protein
MPFIYATTGFPARLGLTHLDVVEEITSTRSYDRTNTALERGAPVTAHRQRVPWVLTLRVLVSDTSPTALGGGLIAASPKHGIFVPYLTPLWEIAHSVRTRDAVYKMQELGIPVPFFDGREFWRNNGGGWVIDSIDDGKRAGEEGVWRASITLGELPRFSTLFTPFPPGVDSTLTDSVDGAVEAGSQSVEDIPVDIASEIPG